MSKPERTIIEIAPKTWLMSEYKLVNTYLLEGEDTAMLIDGGLGVGKHPIQCQLIQRIEPALCPAFLDAPVFSSVQYVTH